MFYKFKRIVSPTEEFLELLEEKLEDDEFVYTTKPFSRKRPDVTLVKVTITTKKESSDLDEMCADVIEELAA